MQFPWNWMLRQAKVCQVCHGRKRWVRHFCAADPDLKGWSANAASPARFFAEGVSVKLGFAGKRMKWLGKRGALKWKLCKWLKTFKQLYYIIILDSRMEWMIRLLAIRIKDRCWCWWPLVDSNLRKATFSMVTWGIFSQNKNTTIRIYRSYQVYLKQTIHWPETNKATMTRLHGSRI